MAYLPEPPYAHGSPARAGVLLVNLGTPDEATAPAVRRYLAHYMARWRPEALGEPAFTFRAPDGGQWSADRVGQVLRELGRQAGVAEVRAHRFRHTFAYRFIRNGGDPFSLQRILGHADIKTTMIYVYMQDQDLQDKHRLASPVDRMRGLPRFKGGG